MVKAVFFDIDGTLMVPNYLSDGKIVVGFTDEAWFNHCNTYKEHCYDYAKVVKPVKRYAEARKAEGAKVYVLTVSQTEGERLGKAKIIKDRFPGLFEETIQVESNDEKIRVMAQYAIDNNLKHEEIEIVEDTYTVVLKANDNNFIATHVSEIVCEL